jgi:prepilin-type N-terminal cleavage/methylation domain-containing protein
LRRARGFTLIEMLAVIALFGLIAVMVVPNLDLGGSRAVRSDAADLAAAIEFARQRAVMTGRTHVVTIEIEAGAHWVSWAAPPEPPPPTPPDDAEAELQLVPPPLEIEELLPVPGEFGRPRVIDDGVAILAVEIPQGIADTGSVEIRIGGDGVSDPAAILLGTLDGEYPIRVEVEPLADVVQVVNAE